MTVGRAPDSEHWSQWIATNGRGFMELFVSLFFLRRHSGENIVAQIFSGDSDQVVEFDGFDAGVESFIVIVSQAV